MSSLYDTHTKAMNILIVDDHRNMLETISDVVEEMGHNAFTSLSAEEAYTTLASEEIDILLTDLILTGDTGLQLLSYTKRTRPDISVLVISGHGTVETAVTALKDGALDFLEKPLDLTRLRTAINVAVRFRSMTMENRFLTTRLKERDVLERIIGRTPEIRRVKQLISQIASSSATSLVTGESGTGKELVAEAIHYLSPRASRQLVCINSASLSSSLLESELFGHEKGAFTGAVKTKAGQFEIADGGTIFFDEIGDMPLSIQSKILRVLERKSYNRVGGTKPINVDVRVIAATNADLKKLIEEKKFRTDLFYRLNVISIDLPSLRDRADDIPLLIAHFLGELNERDSRNCSIEPDALEAMFAYSWPGNIRELRNCLERSFLISSEDRIRRHDLPVEISKLDRDSLRVSTRLSYAGRKMDDIERDAILSTLDSVNGNKSKASALLGIGLKTLYRKLEKWGLHETKKE